MDRFVTLGLAATTKHNTSCVKIFAHAMLSDIIMRSSN